MKQTKTSLELLAPAKNLACGMAAIDHGADAVYIGAARFGARAAAGNTVEDIALLCQYAHQFGAKVYVTTNTIIYDDEMEDTLSLVKTLHGKGVDAFLVQDMGLLSLIRKHNSDHRNESNFREIVVHASTQTDNRTVQKVEWLAAQGCHRVVLARELSHEEIKNIHREVPGVELEVFVHGALCVSYSGVCYASQHCFGRSANRGECAQFCRMKFDLLDADGHEIVHQRHLLSLKDLCLIDHLGELADAGACSFKIEGRLKDVSYVKNVVAAYSIRLNDVVRQHPDRYCRASWGNVKYAFKPDLRKTFNRTYTEYFYAGRVSGIASFDTPKALGEYVGQVKSIQQMVKNGRNSTQNVKPASIVVAGVASFSNGDGLCFFNHERELVGFRVNRAEGNRLFPQRMPAGLQPGMKLYRNSDEAFQHLLAGTTAERKIAVTMHFGITPDGFVLRAAADVTQKWVAEECLSCEKEPARQSQRDNIMRQLSRLGNTIFVCSEVVVDDNADKYFVPSSMLADLRRRVIDHLTAERPSKNSPVISHPSSFSILPPSSSYKYFPYLYNISNKFAEKFYLAQGMEHVFPAFELREKSGEKNEGKHENLIMQCRHCIRFSLGYCEKRGGKRPAWHEPLSLRLADGTTYPLRFNCKECQMEVYG